MGFTGAHSMIDVELISETTIKPSNPTPTHLRFLKTSLFERVTYPVFMPFVFFYAPPIHTTTTTRTNNNTTKLFLDRLRNSLPKTLSLFYPLAGRVQDDNPLNYIICNDEGVPYIETQVSGVCFNNFVNKAEPSELDKLLPYHGSHGFTKLLLAIQVNAFPCGGVAIAVKISHALSDAFSQLMFVKTWADIANSNNVNVNKPYFEIHKLFPPPSSVAPKTIDAIRSPDFVDNKPVTKWFRFTRPKLDRLRSNIMSISPNHSTSNKNPSIFLVLSGFILSRLKLACKDYDEDNARNVPYEIISAVNIRRKLSPPPGESSYFHGNVFINAIAKPLMKASDTESLCLEFINEMSKSIGNILSDDMRLIKDAQQGKEDLNSVIESFERGLRGEVFCMIFSNLRNFPVYEADFGWGKPVWVTLATFSCVGTNMIFPAATGHDIIAFMSLTAQDMARLTRDPEFLSMVSTNNQALSKL